MAAASSVAWTLAVGRGDRTVYAQFQDEAGNWSAVSSDLITVEPPDTTYHPLSPVRLLDTRSANPSGVTRLTSGKPMRFTVAGRGGVPDDAIAVTGNLTVTGSTASGYVTLGPIVGPDPGDVDDQRAQGRYPGQRRASCRSTGAASWRRSSSAGAGRPSSSSTSPATSAPTMAATYTRDQARPGPSTRGRPADVTARLRR